MRASTLHQLAGLCICLCLGAVVDQARGQTFRYQAEPRAGNYEYDYGSSDDVPQMRFPPGALAPDERIEYYGPNDLRRAPQAVPPARQAYFHRRFGPDRVQLTASGEPIPPGVRVEPFVEDAPPGPPGAMYGGGDMSYDNAYQGAPMEGDMNGEPFLQEPGGDNYGGNYGGGDCGGCGNCAQCCGGGGRCYMKRLHDYVHTAHCNGAFCENFSLFSGKQGFKGPVDQGVNGDFGFHAGGNWGMPFIPAWGLGFQVGLNLIASDFEGRTGPLGHRRYQLFGTLGLFHRADCGNGLQGGAVVDYLRDDFYVQMDLAQVRGEASYLWHYHELGAWCALMTNTSTHLGNFQPTDPLQTFSFQAQNQYNLFYRYQFCTGSYCRTWTGISGHGDWIFGGDSTIQISPKVGILATYNYLLPNNDPTTPLNVKESWNLSISLVWYPWYNKRDSWTNPYRPLFYTADNAWFLTRQAN